MIYFLESEWYGEQGVVGRQHAYWEEEPKVEAITILVQIRWKWCVKLRA